MEKLEVGMYVRTNNAICKCLNIYIDGNNPKLNRFMNEWGNIIMFDQIIKISHTLLGNRREKGVIEIGDYINGYKVSLIGEDFEGMFVQCDYPVEVGTTNHYRFYEKSIGSIVTKEAFESMSCYVN